MKTYSGKFQGFTLIELLAVIAIIGVLAAILIPVVARVREHARQAVCASNLRQIGISAHLYAAQNDDRLPTMQGGNWAWDVEYQVMGQLIQVGGGERDVFYCPSSPVEQMREGWEFATDTENQSGYRFISYVLLFNGTPQVDPIAQNVRIGEPLPVQDQGRNAPITFLTEAQKELAADAVIGTAAEGFSVSGGAATPHRPNHVDSSAPRGGNIVFLDGHVEWRPFNEMSPRTSGPTFWW